MLPPGGCLLIAVAAHALPLQITSASLAPGIAGTAYIDTVRTVAGTPPLAFTILSGTLPAGLALDGASGAIAGTPTVAGPRTFVVGATDALGDTASAALGITVAPGPAAALAFVVAPSNVVAGVSIAPAVQVRVADAFGNGVAGQSVALALTGTGTLSGGGSVLTDANGLAAFASVSLDKSGSKQLTATSGALAAITSAVFTVSPAPVAALSFDVQPSAVLVNAAITPAVRVRATDSFGNATPAVAVSLGISGGGVLAGGPPVATDAAGLATFSALSVDRPGTMQLAATTGLIGPVFSAAFLVSCPTISLLPATLPIAQLNVLYTQTITATGATAPYTFAVTGGGLPAGLTLASGGVLSGYPTVAGTFGFTVTANSASTGGCTGSLAYSINVPPLPAAVADLVATRLVTGNDASGIERIQLAWSTPPLATAAEVWRAPFGGYPRYDDAGGLLPPTPSYPPGPPWTLTPVTTSGQTDKPASRDAWSYVVFTKNAFGQPAPVSNKTIGIPDYAPGDVSNGIAAGSGDNLVNAADLSALGAHYGSAGSAITAGGFSYLDVGPTADFGPGSRPLTDNRIDFEDLIIFALNYGAVAAPGPASQEVVARVDGAPDRLELTAPSLVEAGATFDVALRMAAAGRVQGVSAQLAWDAAVAGPIGVTSGGWVESQTGVVLSARPGNVDAALLGARATGLAGDGTIATVRFRALRTGDPAIGCVEATARDAANRTLTAPEFVLALATAPPASSVLLAPFPNPARLATAVPFALARAGVIDLAIYSIDGRLVRSLAHGPFVAGSHRLSWAGDDDAHRPVSAGVYYARLVTPERRFTRALVRLR